MVGHKVGFNEGELVGHKVGFIEGELVGEKDGSAVGPLDELNVVTTGSLVGLPQNSCNHSNRPNQVFS